MFVLGYGLFDVALGECGKFIYELLNVARKYISQYNYIWMYSNGLSRIVKYSRGEQYARVFSTIR